MGRKTIEKYLLYYVYIIKSNKTGKLYKGSTEDLKQRIKDHNAGQVRYTQSGKPWKLIYYEAFLYKKDARREELFLKSGKGRKRINWLFKNS